MPEPERIEPSSLADYLETMSKSVFQTGISWRVVESKWPDIREAFRDFDPNVVANLSESDLDELTNDRRVIRNRRKLEAIVENSRRMIEFKDTSAHTGTLRRRCQTCASSSAFWATWAHTTSCTL